MANGLSNRNSGSGSRGGNKRPPPSLLNDADDTSASGADEVPEQDELSDVVLDAEPDIIEPETLELETLESEALEAEIDVAPTVRTKSPLRLLEARWEEKRLNALLKEVYDDE